MRQRMVPYAVIALVVAAGVLYWQRSDERMVEVVPGIFVSWDGTRWALLDGRHSMGTQGGIVVVEPLGDLQVLPGRAVIGRDVSSGAYFIMPLDKGDYLDTKRFASEAEWRAACRDRGIGSPSLGPP